MRMPARARVCACAALAGRPTFHAIVCQGPVVSVSRSDSIGWPSSTMLGFAAVVVVAVLLRSGMPASCLRPARMRARSAPLRMLRKQLCCCTDAMALTGHAVRVLMCCIFDGLDQQKIQSQHSQCRGQQVRRGIAYHWTVLARSFRRPASCMAFPCTSTLSWLNSTAGLSSLLSFLPPRLPCPAHADVHLDCAPSPVLSFPSLPDLLLSLPPIPPITAKCRGLMKPQRLRCRPAKPTWSRRYSSTPHAPPAADPVYTSPLACCKQCSTA